MYVSVSENKIVCYIGGNAITRFTAKVGEAGLRFEKVRGPCPPIPPGSDAYATRHLRNDPAFWRFQLVWTIFSMESSWKTFHETAKENVIGPHGNFTWTKTYGKLRGDSMVPLP